jgi:Arc/MetJ-type ribon-helix-helix transcriptional regulator
MKVKTSITLSSEVLHLIDQRQREFKSRSEFMECAAREMLAQLARTEAEQSDLEIINRRAKELNFEAEDVLAYQAPL